MKIATWNIQHRSGGKALEYISSINPDIICLQELNKPSEVLDSKYKWYFSPTSEGWGNLFASQYPMSAVYTEDKDFVGRVQSIVVTTPLKKKITIANIHVPITKGYARHNLSGIFEIVFQKKETESIIVSGDFNFGLFFDEKYFEDILGKYNLIDCDNKPSFIGNRRTKNAIQIDHIVYSSTLKEQFIEAKTIDSTEINSMSDHRPIIAEFNI